MREGRFDQFDVLSDGTIVFSKALAGRFPRPGEVLELLRA
jgi:hypothetical protein